MRSGGTLGWTAREVEAIKQRRSPKSPGLGWFGDRKSPLIGQEYDELWLVVLLVGGLEAAAP